MAGTGRRIRILHLRQASGGGGGADTVLMDMMDLADSERFRCAAAYLHRKDRDVGRIMERMRAHGHDHTALPGGRILDPVQLAKLKRLIVDSGADVLHCHDSKAYVCGRLVRPFIQGLRLAATLHGWPITSWRSGLYIRAAQIALRGFDIVHAVAEDVAAMAAAAGVRGVHVIPNGVNLQRWTPRPSPPSDDTPFTVGMVARLSPEKNVDLFVQVAGKALQAIPNARFLVAGEGPEKQRMQALAQKAGLGDSIKFLGYLGEEEVRAMYASLDALLLTSLSEGTPMTLLEGAATGVPVVSTRVGGVGDVFTHGETAHLAPSGDAQGLVDGLVELANNPALADARASAALQTVRDGYDMTDRIRRLEALYAGAVGGGAP